MIKALLEQDYEIASLIKDELLRQQNTIELIASENIVSQAVLEAAGSILTNKYAEGYSGKRYYGGCEHIDKIEDLAISRVKKLFNAGYANVQPHSGSQANFGVFLALLNPGDTILSMSLDCGGHLTHGAPVSVSGKWFNVVNYTVDPTTEQLNYDTILELAKQHKPKLIITGYSAYSRIIDFAKFKSIAESVNAYLMADMAHTAGLVAAGLFPSPVPHADVVTSTTHKTLRGPRGGIILTNNADIAKKVNSAIFPGSQGGPLMHIIAAKAVAFAECLKPEFKEYAAQVIATTSHMAKVLMNKGLKIVSGGTDNHLFSVNLNNLNITGAEAVENLEIIGITCNKNTIPFETKSPQVTSGIRIGTAAITSRGMGLVEVEQIANIIYQSLFAISNRQFTNDFISKHKQMVKDICSKYPIYMTIQ